MITLIAVAAGSAFVGAVIGVYCAIAYYHANVRDEWGRRPIGTYPR